jgi:hypothetical protein
MNKRRNAHIDSFDEKPKNTNKYQKVPMLDQAISSPQRVFTERQGIEAFSGDWSALVYLWPP